MTIGSRPRAFRQVTDGVRTLPLSTPKGWLRKQQAHSALGNVLRTPAVWPYTLFINTLRQAAAVCSGENLRTNIHR